MTVISVIVGSTREGRFSEKPAKWILHHLKKRDGVDASSSSPLNTTTDLLRCSRTPLGLSGVASQGGLLRELWLRGGARSVQQLRQTVIELQLAPIRSSVHIPVATLMAHYRGGDVDAGLAELEAPAEAMIDDLLWWTTALKTARASAS
jgi:NAD(P)H-dependent FMN reductase